MITIWYVKQILPTNQQLILNQLIKIKKIKIKKTKTKTKTKTKKEWKKPLHPMKILMQNLRRQKQNRTKNLQ